MRPESGILLGGKYLLEQPLASGGMGSVWVARHTELDCPIAVKFIGERQLASSKSRARFEREARAAAALRSPHVVQILDYGVEDDEPYIVMELCAGQDLETLIEAQGRLSLARISGIVTQAAKALKLAHDAGVVHRDIKPSNLFLARIGEEEVVKVLDFGIAKEMVPAVNGPKTSSGVLLGSPYHMSPEQALGGTIDARSDIWSLGVVVFRALTGRQPFGGPNLGVVIALVLSQPPVPTAVAPDLPPEIDAFFERVFQHDPERRFPSVKAMAEALGAIARAHPDEPKTESALGAGALPAEPPAPPHDDAPVLAPRDLATVDAQAELASTHLGMSAETRGRGIARHWPYAAVLGCALLGWLGYRALSESASSASPVATGAQPAAERAALEPTAESAGDARPNQDRDATNRGALTAERSASVVATSPASAASGAISASPTRATTTTTTTSAAHSVTAPVSAPLATPANTARTATSTTTTAGEPPAPKCSKWGVCK